MTRLAWGAHGERYFEAGTDRGVLYLDGQTGVPWNGLRAVNEAPSGGEPRPYYVDGFKYLNVATAEEFKATLDAFSSPPEFGVCDGTKSIQNGLFVTQQPRKQFNLSYRTMVGNDHDGVDHAYKIHVVYNALAAPSTRNNQTRGSDSTPMDLSWSITTRPPKMNGLRPTAHVVIDSRLTPPALLASIEDILYGGPEADAMLPSMPELMQLFQSEGPLKRVNYVHDPQFFNPGGNWAISGGTYTVEGDILDIDFNAAKADYFLNSVATWYEDFVPGVYYSVGYLVENLSGRTLILRANVWTGLSWVYGSEVLIPDGESRRVSIDSKIVPVGATTFVPVLSPSISLPIAATDRLRISEPIVEMTRFLGAYFDGNMEATETETYEWETAAGDSRSLLYSWY